MLVTVPLGVLKRERLEFVPPLSERKLGAISRLGFGVLNKARAGPSPVCCLPSHQHLIACLQHIAVSDLSAQSGHVQAGDGLQACI